MNDATRDTVIAVEGLTVRYDGRAAVSDVSFRVARGEVYALLGRNGAGKSSLMRCLAGARRPDVGRCALLGLDAWRDRARAMRRVGVVPEDPDAPPTVTVERLVRFCARVDRGWDAGAVRARLGTLGIDGDAAFGDLSKGQKKLVSLTLALGHRPDVVLLDDPTLGLDVAMRRTLYEEIVGELADRGTTVLVTTHDLGGVEGIADRIGVLVAGRLVVDAPLERLKAEHPGATALEEIFLSVTGKREEVA